MRRALIVLVLVLAALLGGLTAFDFLAPQTAARLGVELERARSGLVLKRATVGEFEIAYLEGGSGEPLILVHGFGADKDNFTRVARLLTPHYRVIIPDLPGFGESSKPADASYRVPDQAERLHGFTRGLGIERAHLGGSSMGGWIVTEYALHYPAEVGSLWLLGPAGTAKAFDSELTGVIQKEGRNPLLARTADDFPAIMAFVMSRPPFFPYSVKKVLGERAAADYPLHERIFAQLNEPQTVTTLLDGRITGLATPALVVWGDRDRALNYQAAEVYTGAMPKAKAIIMQGIGHLPMIEAVAQSAQDYLAFRESLRQP